MHHYMKKLKEMRTNIAMINDVPSVVDFKFCTQEF